MRKIILIMWYVALTAILALGINRFGVQVFAIKSADDLLCARA
jgi:hypothetical protein